MKQIIGVGLAAVGILAVAIPALADYVQRGRELETQPIERLQFTGFDVPAPLGWSRITEREFLTRFSIPAGGYAITPSDRSEVIVVAEVPGAFTIAPASESRFVEECRTEGEKIAASKSKKRTVANVRISAFGGFKGCDLELVNAEYSARMLLLSDGKVQAVIACERRRTDDSMCEAIANSITVK